MTIGDYSMWPWHFIEALPDDIQKEIKSLYLTNPMLHNIIASIHAYPHIPMTEILWRFIIPLIKEWDNFINEKVESLRYKTINHLQM